MSVSVNADDFGMSIEINDAIIEAFLKKYIDTTTLMANMPAAEDAYAKAKKHGLLDKVGIHLNITAGVPLTEGIRNNPLICDSKGEFNAAFYHNTKYRLYMDELTISEIRAEFDAQLKRFLDLGFFCMHVDSHHHVHTNIPVFKAIKQLSDKYDYDYIRLSRNLYHGGSFVNSVYKYFYNASVKKSSRTSADVFGSYRDYMTFFGLDPYSEADRSLAMNEDMKKYLCVKNVEIMVHPMFNEEGVLVDTDIPMSEERALRNE